MADKILDELVRLGASSETIVAVAKLIADAANLKERREKHASYMRAWRHVSSREFTSDHVVSPERLSLREESKKERKEEKQPRKRGSVKTPLPDDWQPKGPQRDPKEADEFRDHARAKGYRYADWDAAYRNFQKSPYNARNASGGQKNGRRHGSVLDAFDRLGERLEAAGATDDYVPGSGGPSPLELGPEMRAANLKLISKG